jgi:hypothetical protein
LNTTPRKERQERIEYSVKGKMERNKKGMKKYTNEKSAKCIWWT